MTDNFADYQQRRGAALDIIDEAIESYRSYMFDDDYDAQGALDRIMSRMKKRRADITDLEAELKQSDAALASVTGGKDDE